MFIVKVAGGLYTDLDGQQFDFDISEFAADKEYAVFVGAPRLHNKVIALVRETYGLHIYLASWRARHIAVADSEAAQLSSTT